LRDVRNPLPAAPAQPVLVDVEYPRGGVANSFVVREPLAERRWVTVTEHRAKPDWAQQIKSLVKGWYLEAERIVLVQDNLNTHTPAALYDAFAPAGDRQLIKQIEWHFTPKHGSWLNMVEIELSVLADQCLARRIPDLATMAREVAAWETARNAARATVALRFITSCARTTLDHIYPQISCGRVLSSFGPMSAFVYWPDLWYRWP
jgi:hypothetical protein